MNDLAKILLAAVVAAFVAMLFARRSGASPGVQVGSLVTSIGGGGGGGFNFGQFGDDSDPNAFFATAPQNFLGTGGWGLT